jgi:hypothetical protein
MEYFLVTVRGVEVTSQRHSLGVTILLYPAPRRSPLHTKSDSQSKLRMTSSGVLLEGQPYSSVILIFLRPFLFSFSWQITGGKVL